MFWSSFKKVQEVFFFLFFLSLGYLLFQSYFFFREKRKYKIRLRAILKKYAYEELPKGFLPYFRNFFLAFFLFFLISWIYISITVYHTDHNFWILLYPILVYYTIGYYLLWEKKDLK